MQGCGALRTFFVQFYALLATQFYLPGRLIRRRWARRYVSINVPAFTALFICLFRFKFLHVVL